MKLGRRSADVAVGIGASHKWSAGSYHGIDRCVWKLAMFMRADY